jgi:hypothetical protein
MTIRTKFKAAKIAAFALVFAVVSLAVLSAPQIKAARAATIQRGEFMIVNKTHYTFMRLYLSSSARNAWGADQLGRKTIEPGNSYMLTGIACGLYDVKVVDEDNDACVVTEVPICRNHTHWEMTDDLLASCEGY